MFEALEARGPKGSLRCASMNLSSAALFLTTETKHIDWSCEKHAALNVSGWHRRLTELWGRDIQRWWIPEEDPLLWLFLFANLQNGGWSRTEYCSQVRKNRQELTTSFPTLSEARARTRDKMTENLGKSRRTGERITNEICLMRRNGNEENTGELRKQHGAKS
ncbi:hypothetical protein MRB53_040011 [Persea americana]|nr:hypothetical protein MRB53_040011 [Persea americana]